jgi:hypothetical protein
MRPAFSSTRQAGAFLLLLLVLLLLPAFMGKPLLPSREQVYSAIPWADGDYPYLDKEFFQERGDIDIAFIGPSHIWMAIDAPYVQAALSKKLGRPAVVRTYGWNWPGYDAMYLITKDLLEHRKVRNLVFYDAYDVVDVRPMPHVLATHLFRFGDDAADLSGLPLYLQASYYFAAILGTPRNLLNLTSPNLPAEMFDLDTNTWIVQQHAASPAVRNGALSKQLGFSFTPPYNHAAFTPYKPVSAAQPSDFCVYSAETRTNFEFSGPPFPPAQMHFAGQFADLARSYNCNLILLHVPVFSERRSPVIHEHLYWPDALHSHITMIGIPPAKLFAGLFDGDLYRLYCDRAHFNQNGQTYFTRLVTPALLSAYEERPEY